MGFRVRGPEAEPEDNVFGGMGGMLGFAGGCFDLTEGECKVCTEFTVATMRPYYSFPGWGKAVGTDAVATKGCSIRGRSTRNGMETKSNHG